MDNVYVNYMLRLKLPDPSTPPIYETAVAGNDSVLMPRVRKESRNTLPRIKRHSLFENSSKGSLRNSGPEWGYAEMTLLNVRLPSEYEFFLESSVRQFRSPETIDRKYTSSLPSSIRKSTSLMQKVSL